MELQVMAYMYLMTLACEQAHLVCYLHGYLGGTAICKLARRMG